MRFGVPTHCVWCAAPVGITTNGRREVIGICGGCGLVQPRPSITTQPRCAYCGQPFQPHRKDQRYCHPRHKWLAWKARHRPLETDCSAILSAS